MLKVKNLNKYFNPGTNNEIHVIDDTTFDLGKKGLISILGHSGSGKTTLLNSLSGIDKVDFGEIIIDGITIKKYNANKMDDIRNKYFGYIFQNYNLINSMTVFENVAFSLQMLGIKDKKEIEERTIKALKVVKMDKYKNRLAKNLSGGQMQRVSIARAIVKDAKIILADEATGNLDRKNTVIIMSILREIANDRLVVMVTHERELAYAYSDRILEIQDGVIVKDELNDAMSAEYSYDDENLIHLGDYQKDELYKNDETVVNKYSDGESGNVKIDFIIRNNQVLIQTKSNMEVRIVDDKSLVKFDYLKKEDYKTPIIDKEEVKIDPIDKSKLKCKYRLNVIKLVKESIIKLFSGKTIKMFVLLAFTLSALLLTLSVGLLRGFGSIDETKFMKTNKDLLKVTANNIKRETFNQKFKEITSRDDVYRFVFSVPDVHITTTLYEGSSDTVADKVQISALIQDASNFNIDKELLNKLDDRSVIIDKYLIEHLLRVEAKNYQTEKAILQQRILINGVTYKIAGITDQQSLNIYVKTDIVDKLNYSYKGIMIDDTVPDGEIKLHKQTYYNNYYRSTYQYYGIEYKIYRSPQGDEYSYVQPSDDGIIAALNQKTLIELLKYRMFNVIFDNEESLGKAEFYVYTTDYQSVINAFDKDVLEFRSEYDISKRAYEQKYLGVTLTIALVSLIAFIAPLIMLYFLMRSSTISKIKEIAIFRALGMRNSTVIGMQFIELATITTIFSLPGYLGAIIFMFATNGVFANYSLDIFTLGGSLVLIFAIILLVGILPILRIVKKVPQELITKYDI